MNKIIITFILSSFFGLNVLSDEVFLKTLKNAELGDPISQNNVGHMYDNGIGTEKNIQKAFEWYVKASDQNQVNAMTSKASFYLDGEIVDQNYSTAFKIYKKAANLKYEESAFFKMAKKENQDYQTLFLQNQSRAIYALGLMYEKGQATNIDYSEAKKLYVQADSNGHELSKIRHDALNGDPGYALYLAKNYLDGSLIEIGIPIDYEEAAFWFKISEYLGFGEPESFDKALKLISEIEFNKASKRFEAWKANMGFEHDKETLQDISKHFINHYGTGFYISDEILISNKHVLLINEDEEKQCSKLLAYNPYNSKFENLEYIKFRSLPKIEDVKFVKSSKKTENYISISNEEILPAEEIYVVGFPAGRETTNYPRVSKGIVNSDIGLLNNVDQFIFDAFSEGGSSGSPILNSNGELLGVLWGGGTENVELSTEEIKQIQRTNEGFGIKSDYLVKLLEYNNINFPNRQKKITGNVSQKIRDKMKAVRLIECYDKFDQATTGN